MMAAQLVYLMQEALILVLWCSAPPVVASVLVGTVTASLQTVTQIQDASLSTVPRMVAVYGSLVIAGPWIGHQLVRFATAAFDTISMVG